MICHKFHLNGEDTIESLGLALVRAANEVERYTGLTLTVSNTTIERNPLGNDMWVFSLKVNDNAE